MKNLIRLGCPWLLLFLFVGSISASSSISLSPDELVQLSGAIFRGTVTRMSCYKDADGLIYTRTSLRVDEPLKGKFPSALRLVHRGGQVGFEDEFYGLSPRFKAGDQYLVFVHRRTDGQLECTQGSASAVILKPSTETPTGYASPGGDLLTKVRKLAANGTLAGDDVTDQATDPTQQAAVGMLGGIASRFLQPDRGEPIPYLIDVGSLTNGITLTQATNAVQQALNAWKAVTSLKFQLVGIQSFGQGADAITTNSEMLYIQLHDNYARINSATTLGIGGRNALTSPVPGVGWDLGGTIAGNDFRKTTRGYVVLEATNAAMHTLSTFTEVLCHEIGHALSMAHSSENPSEPDTTLKQAIMYYMAHQDGRGATLGAYDPPVIQQAYPQFNTAPYTYNRVMDAVSAPTAPVIPGINEVQMRGYDLQTPSASLTFATAGATANNGNFSITGTLVKFDPYYFGSDSLRFDPTGSSFWDIVYTRFSDGTNSSPYATMKIISFSNDDADWPSLSDGLPNTWLQTYFGHTTGQAGDESRAQDDADGDHLNTLDEFRSGMSPTDGTSAQRITLINATNIQWQVKPYELYELLGSSDLSTWTRVGNPILPTNSPASVALSATNSQQYFRILKVP